MELTVLVNPSQSSAEAPKGEFAVAAGHQMIIIDRNKHWVAALAHRRWASAADDHLFLKACDLNDQGTRDSLLDELARSTTSIHFVASEADEETLRAALVLRPTISATYARIGERTADRDLLARDAQRAPENLQAGQTGQTVPGKLGLLLIHINSYDITRECLQSLEATTYANKRIFLLENSSSNFSALRLFLEFPSVVVLFGVSRISYCNSFNLLADFAIRQGCEFLFVSNNDTRGHSSNIFEALTAGITGNIGMVSPKVYDFDHALLRSGSVNHFGVDFSLATEAYVISAQLWQQVDGFSNAFNIYCEDVDLLLRVRALGKEGRYDDSVEMEHLQNGATRNKVFIRTFFYMRNIVWVQKRRNVRVVYDIAYYSAQEAIQLFLWAGRLVATGDLYPFFSVLFLVPAGVLAGIFTRPRRNRRSDLSRALQRSNWELKFKVR